MRMPLISPAALIPIVAVVAVDCAWLRHHFTTDAPALRFLWPAGADWDFELGLLGMSTVLALVAILTPRRRAAKRPFLAGFMASGSAAMVAYVACCWLFEEAVSEAMRNVTDIFLDSLPRSVYQYNTGRPLPVELIPPLVALIAAALTLPQLVVALAGGWLAWRIARRPRMARCSGLETAPWSGLPAPRSP